MQPITYLHPSPEYVSDIIRKDGFYELELLKQLEYLLAKRAEAQGYRGAFIDVGANIGNHSSYLAQLGYVGYAYEPCLANYDLLAKNMSGLDVSCMLAAVGNRTGKTILTEPHPGNMGIIKANLSEYEGDISITKLDDEGYDKKPIDLLKIDVEGEEVEVIWGASKLIETHKPIIVAEMSDPLYACMIGAALGRRGYHLNNSFHAEGNVTIVFKC